MDGPGTVTWEEFLENVQNFLSISNKISDGWELCGNKNVPGEAYLFRRAKYFITDDHELKNFLTVENCYEWDRNIGSVKDPFEASSTVETPLIMEHHILWSLSYSVPVLYFNAWKSDFHGVNPISIEEAQKFSESELSYMELSQAIHPILGTPFLRLHPCMSHELLQSTSASKNKLVSWLSSVAPAALNLRISSEYCKLTLPMG